MRLVDAVYERINEFIKIKNMSMNGFANLCGVPRSTIVTMQRSTTVKLSTVQAICDGLNIELKDFFNSPLFARENIDE
ncbi:MAG: helix-turn-helix transcriptional regulator [Clostridia bacterium]|nr:helix-turn-helix transcriptional regulator [Clostridia bacterium]